MDKKVIFDVFENDFVITSMVSKYPERDLETQACYQLAGIAVTWGISIPMGLLFGFITSNLPMPKVQFDDKHTFEHCKYDDNMGVYDEAHVKGHHILT